VICLDDVGIYIAAQFAGAITGAIIVWLSYRQHFEQTPDGDTKLAVFCTAPAIKSPLNNFITEMVGTFVFSIRSLTKCRNLKKQLGALDALPVALLILGIGLSLGWPYGYPINPAQRFGSAYRTFYFAYSK
jgi:glycerol uptake facilitator protein